MSDQIEAAAAVMTRDYIIFAFLVSLGALQISVSISDIRGLWLTPSRILTRTLGIILIVLGLAFYILSPLWLEGPWAAGSVVDGTSEGRVWGTATLNELSAARNLNDIHGGMAGTAYAAFFVLSAVLATFFAAVIGTINIRLFPSPSRSEGDAWSGAITQGVPESSNPCSSETSAKLPSFSRGLPRTPIRGRALQRTERPSRGAGKRLQSGTRRLNPLQSPLGSSRGDQAKGSTSGVPDFNLGLRQA